MEIQRNASANITNEQKIASEQAEAEAKLKLTGELTEKGLIRFIKSNGDIMYTEYFYSQMNKLMDAGKSAAAAYEELGFAVDMFGLNRAEQAGKNARIRARNQGGYRFTARNGAVPLSENKDFVSMPPEVKVDYLISKLIYMDELLEISKKKELRCGSERIWINLEINVDKGTQMKMAENCIERFKNPETLQKYGLTEAPSQKNILTIFNNVHESTLQSSRARRKKQEEKLKREAERRQKIKEEIANIINRYNYVPGKKPIRLELARLGYHLSLKSVKKLMDEMRIVASKPQKDPYKFEATHNHPLTAPGNLVNQNFFVGPRQVILTDITYIKYQKEQGEPGKEEVFYLCVFKDAFTAEILGYETSESMTVDLVKDAYRMMIERHGFELGLDENGKALDERNVEVYLHSDQGSQYLSTSFQTLLATNSFTQSCSRRGDSQDNAPCESFFQKLKYRLGDAIFLSTTYDTASMIVKGYIESYNSKVVQMGLAGLTPNDFYKYAVTGIYPFSEYYGVKPDISNTEDILRKIIENRNAESERRKIKRREKQERDLMNGCGESDSKKDKGLTEIVRDDLKRVETLERRVFAIIDGCEKVKDFVSGKSLTAQEESETYANLHTEVSEALKTLQSLTEEQLQELMGDKEKLAEYLPYLEKMRCLFSYNPLKAFVENLQKMLRSVGFVPRYRRSFRWWNCPAAQEILKAGNAA